MLKILTSGEMKGADEAAMEMGLPSLVLMERAALSVMDVIDEEELDTSDVLIVCGTGNNGGDGAAIARLFAERGEKVSILFPCGTSKVSEQLGTQLKVLGHYDVDEVSCYETGRYSLVIDALFGIGLSREVTGKAAEVIKRINEDDAFVLAVDIASGLDGNTGEVCGCAVKADITVTFAAAKRGHFLNKGPAFTGDLFVQNIGIPLDNAEDAVISVEDDDFESLPLRDETGNKGTFGKLLVVAGSRDMCGAAYFTAAAALKSGIGMVRIFTSEKNRTALSVLLPEALITTYEEEKYDKEALKKAYEWADAVAAGPGLSVSGISEEILRDLLDMNKKPMVMDADALTIMAAGPELWEKVDFPCVITPHMGEMSRLCGKSIADIKKDPIAAASGFVSAHKVTCVLKDAATVIAYSDGRVFINTSGNSALATAGSGDVLTGLIAGFMLQYGDTDLPVEAMAVHYHGRLGEAAAEEASEESVTAGSLLKIIS